MFSRLKLSTQAMILIGLPLFLELCFATVLISTLLALESTVDEDMRVRTLTQAIWSCLFDATQMFTAFNKSDTWQSWRSAGQLIHGLKLQLRTDLEHASQFAAGHPGEEQLVNHIEEDFRGLVQVTVQVKHDLLSSFDPRKNEKLRASQLRFYMHDLTSVCDQELQGETSNLESTLKQRLMLMHWSENVVRTAFPASLILSVALALGFQRNAINRLRIVTYKANQLGAGGDIGPPLPGRDEIALLDQTFVSMAAAIKDTENKERSLLRNSADVLITLNLAGEISSISPSCKRILGYEAEALINSSIRNLLQDKELERMLAMSPGMPNQSFEFSVRRPDSSSIDVGISASRSENETFCVLRDITARKARERFKQELLSIVSHDLRSPLSGILSLNEMLRDARYATLSDEGLRELSQCSKRISTMLVLATDLLEIDKMEGGWMTPNFETVDIEEAAREAWSEIGSMNKRIQIVCDALRSSTLYADRHCFKQVISKLLDNSIMRSPPDDPIVITLSSDDNFIDIICADSGPGIEPGDLPRMFEKFQALSQASGISHPSSLGLSVAKALIELHHGTIECQSDGISGARFHARFPLGSERT